MKTEKIFNKKKGVFEYQARFQLSGKEFRPRALDRKTLKETIDEIRARQHRTKNNLEIQKAPAPTVAELFNVHLEKLKKGGNRKKISIFERVSKRLLELIPLRIRTNELKKVHFQKYIDVRLDDINPQSERNIQPETVNKELFAIAAAFKRAPKYFEQLEDTKPPEIPKAEIPKGERRRERLVEHAGEFSKLLKYLRREHNNSRFTSSWRRIADDLEIRYETGLRRSEVAILEKHQYKPAEAALRDVKRIKTGTVTKFFPLSRRAVEIIESRLKTDSPFLFSVNGKPNESVYRMLKNVCAKLDINYGTFSDGGFVPHDLRHNFATEIIRVTDIETAKNLTGHSGDHILTYLHTDETQMRNAVRRREGVDLTEDLTALYNEAVNGKIELAAFLERVGFLIKNG